MNKRFATCAIYEFTLAGKRVCQFINLQISPFFVVVENKKKQSHELSSVYVIKHICFLYSFVVCILRICKS